MKKLLLFFLFSGSLDSFSQDTPISLSGTAIEGDVSCRGYIIAYDRISATKPDTIHAELLVTYTTRRWGIAHSRDGYVVRVGGKVIRFLDDDKKRFPPNTKFWGWIDPKERVLP